MKAPERCSGGLDVLWPATASAAFINSEKNWKVNEFCRVNNSMPGSILCYHRSLFPFCVVISIFPISVPRFRMKINFLLASSALYKLRIVFCEELGYKS